MPAGRPNRGPDHLSRAVEALNEGRLLRAEGFVDRVLAREPEHAGALRLAGEIARRQGKYRKALDRFIDAARGDPSDLATLEAVIAMAVATDRLDLATQALELAVIAKPSDGSRHARLGAAYRMWSKFDEALGHLRLATTLNPDDPYAWEAMSAVHLSRDEPAAALHAAEQALTLTPDRVVAMLLAATAHEKLGDAVAAQQLRERALEVAPDDPDVAYDTVDLRPGQPDDPRFPGLGLAVEDAARPVQSRVRGMLALAKLHDDADQLELAVRFLRQGNDLWADTLRRQGRGYDPRVIERRLALFEGLIAGGLQGLVAPSQLPVPVIVGGLPRSGKTLIERRLARRFGLPAVGERPVLEGSQRHLTEQLRGRAGGLSDLEPAMIHAFREATCQDFLGDVVDADPPAFVSAGGNLELQFHLAVLLHPGAVLIVCERDSRDLVLANLLKLIPHTNAYSNRIDWLMHRIAARDRAAALWERLLPGQVRRVSYERLVQDEQSVLDELAEVLPVDVVLRNPAPLEDGSASMEVRSPASDPPADLPLHRQHLGMWRRWVPYLPELADLPATLGADRDHGT